MSIPLILKKNWLSNSTKISSTTIKKLFPKFIELNFFFEKISFHMNYLQFYSFVFIKKFINFSTSSRKEKTAVIKRGNESFSSRKNAFLQLHWMVWKVFISRNLHLVHLGCEWVTDSGNSFFFLFLCITAILWSFESVILR